EVFLLPLPEDTVVSDLSMTVDGKVVKGELLDRREARGAYESIVRSRRDPALLEWVGRSCVRLSAFPVPPSGEARVKVRYASVLPVSGGAFELRLPLSLGPVARAALKSLVFQAAIEFSKPIGAIYSPTHPVEVVRTGERSARVSMEGSDVRADRDLRLLVSLAQEEIGLLFLSHRRAGEDGTFLALLSPRLDLEASKVLPKDVVFVLDTSGSMEGEKIAQAKGALRDALGRLNPGDRFHLVRFATEAEAFREGLVPATPGNVEAARAWIAAFEALGGTNLGEALRRALAVPGEPGRLTMLFLLTDGLPTVGTIEEKTLLAEVRRENGARARIFVFGVGVDVNTRLLDTLAEETRAAREYVTDGEAIDLKVASLVDKVSHPILSDPLLFLDGAEARDVYPKRLPDLFRGSPLVVAGRFRGEGEAKVRLRGRFGEGEREWVYVVDLPAVESRNDSIRTTWASRKVGYLLDEIRLNGENAEVVEEVKRLAREHAIVTPYTSLLVREEQRRLSSARSGSGSARVASSSGFGVPPGSG
ncbi:MAG TPA: VIT domain-containing protein, partial [Planctomycetota bacterium]|nr:VIT domain-containing protein [Planctomycetota bacterium]